MMKRAKIYLLALLTLFAFSAVTVTACGKKDDKNKTEKKAGGDKAKGGDTAKGGGDGDVCAKAKKCADGLIKADPDQAKSYEQAWKIIEGMTGDQKTEQCKQLLQGAGFNPKAPPECK